MQHTHIEDFGADYQAARERSEELNLKGYEVDRYPYEDRGFVRWKIRWDSERGIK